MKKSEINLIAIENFIDHYTTNEVERKEMKEACDYYIQEDWTNGKEVEDDQPIFTLSDMRNAFNSGQLYENNSAIVNLGVIENGEDAEMTEPDFDEWIDQAYQVKIN